jgi:SNF2 family DNA or RNA helicase
VLLTTYETFVMDIEYLSKVPFLSVIVDEGHRLRSQKSRLLAELRRIKARHRLLLSGTPLQNSLTELWSLLHFCEPDEFSSKEKFLGKHGELKSANDVAALQKVIVRAAAARASV